ncbi:hypothetical protein NV226_01455 [Mycoplasma iguanae]|uniref:Uncharacterized protein n=1 Tax=Mycoplasma iguanae TaxID=292461 RepID=A0ABY5RCM1_9MOLU|nr:hypothetical protein [Mycoplasma iguanae]UVD81955.1 hypothetical protein NV226_01455 [Mycoplasma iguanae]
MNYFITKVNNKISKITYFNENDNHKEYSIQFIYTKNKTTSLKIKNKQIYLRVGTYATQKI